MKDGLIRAQLTVWRRRLRCRVKKHRPVAPGLFGRIHRDIGELKQFARTLGLAAKHAYADAGGATMFVPVQYVYLAQALHDLLANRGYPSRGARAIAAQMRQHHDKLIPAQTGHGVFISSSEVT